MGYRTGFSKLSGYKKLVNGLPPMAISTFLLLAEGVIVTVCAFWANVAVDAYSNIPKISVLLFIENHL